MSQQVFVTGAAGFIGRHLCQYLVAEGYQVHAVVRCPYPDLERLGVKLWLGDLWDQSIVEAALKDADLIFHCAGNPNYGNGPQYHRANVELTSYLLDQARQSAPNLKRFVFISSIGAIDREAGDTCTSPLHPGSRPAPTSDYGKSKLLAESLVRGSDLPSVIVRPTMVVGQDMRVSSHFAVFARQALSNSIIARFAWPGQFSVIHVDDLVEALHLVATSPDTISNTYFCAGEPVSIESVYKQVAPETKRLPLGWVPGYFRSLIRWLPFPVKALLLPALTASDHEIRALGWKPRYSGLQALSGMLSREEARLDPWADPGGQTVITGAASGLGKALAETLAPIRKRLLLVDRDAEGLAALRSRFPNCEVKVVNLGDPDQLVSLFDSAVWHAHPVSELYACAGFGLRGTVMESSLELQRTMIAVNVLARLTIGVSAMRMMVQRQFGRVVLVSSSSAFQPLPFMATYAATNSALLSLGEAWNREADPHGVHIMSVCPGGMSTNFQSNASVKRIEGERLMKPQVVVAEIMKGLKRKKITIIVSFRAQAMSFAARVLPRKFSLYLWYRLMKSMR